ncbi:MAG: response regulator, partial [Chloroflexi bacterium]|nr:response regulator [Chloroflexota bacterium]
MKALSLASIYQVPKHLSNQSNQRRKIRLDSRPRNILIVDDDPVIRDMMVDILSFEAYPVRVARNGREALEILRATERYLVFLDLMMPVMDGREVC